MSALKSMWTLKWMCALALLCVSGLLWSAPAPQFRQHLGEALPLRTAFVDAQGHARQLGDYFGDTPVVMVFGYYHCQRLCSTIMDGVLQGVQDAGLPYTIIGIGIDPRETSADAATKLAAYRNGLDNANTLHLLTGKQASIARVAQVAGFQYDYDQESDQYSHPAGFLVATPEGRISRYFSGLRFDRRDLRLALIEASDGRVGSLTEQVLLLCSHYDPVSGRYNVAVMAMVRIIGVITLILLVGGICLTRWRASAGATAKRHPQAGREARQHAEGHHECAHHE